MRSDEVWFWGFMIYALVVAVLIGVQSINFTDETDPEPEVITPPPPPNYHSCVHDTRLPLGSLERCGECGRWWKLVPGSLSEDVVVRWVRVKRLDFKDRKKIKENRHG